MVKLRKTYRMRSSVVSKNILSNYPGAVLYGLLFNITLMVDSIIAGWSLGANGIAAVDLFIRSLGKRWNLPKPISENVMAWGGSDTISYSYVYKMNIVYLALAKNKF